VPDHDVGELLREGDTAPDEIVPGVQDHRHLLAVDDRPGRPVCRAGLQHLAALLVGEALEEVLAEELYPDRLGGRVGIESRALGNPQAALGREGATLDRLRLAADERQEASSRLDRRELLGEDAMQDQDPAISR